MPNQTPVQAVIIPEALDVAAIRRKSRATPHTQANFARMIGVPAGTLRQWEQGRRRPTGAARVLLAILDREPEHYRPYPR